MKNPQLKNLLMLSKALITVSDCMQNLTLQDEAEMRAMFGCVPDSQRCEALSDWLNERIVTAAIDDSLSTSAILFTTSMAEA